MKPAKQGLMNKQLGKTLLSFLGLLIIFGVAFGLDRWTEYARQQFSRTAAPFPYMWSWTLANIMLAVCVLLYYTWVMPKLDPWAIGCIVILGLLIDLIPVLYFTPFLNLLPFPIHLPSFFVIRGYFITVGALTAVAGILTLFRTGKT